MCGILCLSYIHKVSYMNFLLYSGICTMCCFFWSFEAYNWNITLFLAKPLEDPKETTDIILKALKDTGQRGIIDRGWGGLGIREYLHFGAKPFHYFTSSIPGVWCIFKTMLWCSFLCGLHVVFNLRPADFFAFNS